MSKKKSSEPSSTIAVDETSVWADMVGQTTVNKTAARDIHSFFFIRSLVRK